VVAERRTVKARWYDRDPLRTIPLLLLLLPGAALADQVFLKDAGSVTGRIVEQTDSLVRVDVGGGIVGLPMDRVDRVVKGRCALDDYEDRAKKLKPNDVEGWKKLGLFASQAGLNAQAQDAFKHVLSLAPNDAEANGALGLVQLDGRWVTEEESYQARGYIRYEGEWMTPAQAQAAQAAAANDQARRDAEDRARDAEAAARDAQARAAEAEAAAKKAQQQSYYNSPVYWGGWGYGVSAWPAGQPAAPATFTPTSQLRRMPR
jgi:hypothetical protein